MFGERLPLSYLICLHNDYLIYISRNVPVSSYIFAIQRLARVFIIRSHYAIHKASPSTKGFVDHARRHGNHVRFGWPVRSGRNRVRGRRRSSSARRWWPPAKRPLIESCGVVCCLSTLFFTFTCILYLRALATLYSYHWHCPQSHLHLTSFWNITRPCLDPYSIAIHSYSLVYSIYSQLVQTATHIAVIQNDMHFG